MDLAQFDLAADAERGTTVQLLNPRTGAPLTTPEGEPVRIFVDGRHSPAWDRAFERVAFDRAMRTWPGMDAPPVAEMAEEHAAPTFAAVTVGWRGIALDGRPLAFSADAALALYRRFPWIVEQFVAVISGGVPAEPDVHAAAAVIDVTGVLARIR
jgi:hypothetical protein